MANKVELFKGPDTPNPFSERNMEISRERMVPQTSVWERRGMDFVFGSRLTTDIGFKAIDFFGGMVGSEMTPEKAKADFGLEVEEPVTTIQALLLQKAREMDDGKKLIRLSQDPYASLDNGFTGAMIDNFLLPVGIFLTDPAGKFVVGKLGKAAHKGSTAVTNMAKLNKYIGSKSSSVINNIAGPLFQGAAGVPEWMLQDYVHKRVADRADLTYGDEEASMMFFGAVVGGMMFDGVGRLGGKASVTARRLTSDALSNYKRGKTPKPGMMQKIFDKSRWSRSNNGTSPTPPTVNTPKVASTYFGVYNSSNNFDLKTQRTFETSYGIGMVATTNKDFAFNEAASVINDTSGSVLTMNTSKLDLLDIERPMPDGLKVKILDRLKVLDKGERKFFTDKLKGSSRSSEFMDFVGQLVESKKHKNFNEGTIGNVKKMVADSIKEEGFDGISFKHKDASGNSVGDASDFGVEIFDPSKAKLTRADKAELTSGSAKPEIGKEVQEYVDAINSKESTIGFNKELDQRFNEISPDRPVIDESAAVINAKQSLTEMQEELGALEIDPKKLEGINKEFAQGRDADTFRKAAKAALFCVRN